jgi:hypothetical protein
MASDAPGMKGYRSRDEDGTLRRKRNDTHIGTIEKQYGVDFGFRSDMHLETLLDHLDANSLSDALRIAQNQKK